MAKRKTAAAQDNAPIDEEIVTLTEQPPTASPTAETASPAAAAIGQAPPSGPNGEGKPSREPGAESEKSWVERASVIVDPEAGVKFTFDYEKHKAIITFDEKPTPALLAVARPILNEGGFQWDKVNKDGWKKKIVFLRREDDRREAKKTFYDVANAIREQKGLPVRGFGEALAF